MLLCSLFLPKGALAANTPCFASKGGIAGCNGDLILCNDGFISGSKKSCAAYMSNFSSSSQAGPEQMLNSSDDYLCGTETFSIGSGCGVYCLTPTGKKSYVRH